MSDLAGLMDALEALEIQEDGTCVLDRQHGPRSRRSGSKETATEKRRPAELDSVVDAPVPVRPSEPGALVDAHGLPQDWPLPHADLNCASKAPPAPPWQLGARPADGPAQRLPDGAPLAAPAGPACAKPGAGPPQAPPPAWTHGLPPHAGGCGAAGGFAVPLAGLAAPPLGFAGPLGHAPPAFGGQCCALPPLLHATPSTAGSSLSGPHGLGPNIFSTVPSTAPGSAPISPVGNPLQLPAGAAAHPCFDVAAPQVLSAVSVQVAATAAAAAANAARLRAAHAQATYQALLLQQARAVSLDQVAAAQDKGKVAGAEYPPSCHTASPPSDQSDSLSIVAMM